MQTFVPYADITESCRSLDRARLGKQRVETLQLLNVVAGIKTGGWVNHPAARMWSDNPQGLAHYGAVVCKEWISRGYKDTCLEKILAVASPAEDDMPWWWGNEQVHASHRSNLMRKMPEHYGQFGWTDDPRLPYIWPTPDGRLTVGVQPVTV
jgi:hypothetical protein